MKCYYQRKNSGFLLPKPIYKKTRNTIACYDFYKDIVRGVQLQEQEAVPQNPERAAINKATAEYYVDAIDTALREYVREDLQEGIFEHVARGKPYVELEESLFYSASTLKLWTQIFVYGVATILGDNFRE